MSIKEVKELDGSTTFTVSVDVRSPDNRSLRIQKSKFGIKSLAEAKREEPKLRREAERELFLKEQKNCSWGSLVDSWESHLRENSGYGKISKITGEDYVAALRIYTSKWNAKSVDEIGRPEVLDVIKVMEELGRSKGRMQCVLIAINQIYRWGIDHRVIKNAKASPAAGLMLKRSEERKPEILTIGQIKKLLDAAKLYNHPWYPIWAMGLLTGMRSGELQALEWSDVDLEGRVITVSKSWNGRLKIVKCTKAGYWREVPINDDLARLLRELRPVTGTSPNVLPRFHNWKRGTTSGILRKFCIGIGLPSIKLHTLRACFATQLFKINVAPAVVMKICGWKDLKTMQRYIRLAGVEITGATDNLQLLSEVQVMGKVMQLFGSQS